MVVKVSWFNCVLKNFGNRCINNKVIVTFQITHNNRQYKAIQRNLFLLLFYLQERQFDDTPELQYGLQGRHYVRNFWLRRWQVFSCLQIVFLSFFVRTSGILHLITLAENHIHISRRNCCRKLNAQQITVFQRDANRTDAKRMVFVQFTYQRLAIFYSRVTYFQRQINIAVCLYAFPCVTGKQG